MRSALRWLVPFALFFVSACASPGAAPPIEAEVQPLGLDGDDALFEVLPEEGEPFRLRVQADDDATWVRVVGARGGVLHATPDGARYAVGDAALAPITEETFAADPLLGALLDGRVLAHLSGDPSPGLEQVRLADDVVDEGGALAVDAGDREVLLTLRAAVGTTRQALEPGILDAAFVGQSVPQVLTVGQRARACVEMHNVGRAPWTRAQEFKLGAQSPQDTLRWGLNRVYLNSADWIAPEQRKNFCFYITAPSAPGTYPFRWRMVQDGVAWFGDLSPQVQITVNPRPEDAATFVRQSVPNQMEAGQANRACVTYRNIGQATWTRAARYKLGSQGPRDNQTWGFARVYLPANVAVTTDREHQFCFDVTAPSAPGTYTFQWRMVHEGVRWFGDISPAIQVQVTRTPFFAPQRERHFIWGALGVVHRSGRKYFTAGGQVWYPKTDFLTAIEPGNNWQADSSLFYFDMSDAKRAQLRGALVGSKYNSAYVYLLNQGDAGRPITPYGDREWSLNVLALNQTRVNRWRAQLIELLDAGIKPFLFMAGDNSVDIQNMSDAQWRAHVEHMVNAFGDLPVAWVVGLEVDEYWSAAKTRARLDYLNSRTPHPVGVHLTHTASANPGNAYRNGAEFVMLQFPRGLTDAQYQSRVRSAADTVRPNIASEYNTVGTARSKAIGSAIGRTGNPPVVAGVGNGISL